MAAPYNIVKEMDLSTRVPSFPGIYGAVVLPAVKGQTEPFLVTSEKQLLGHYTENGKIEVSYDLSYFSALQFLQGSNKLWVSRAVCSPKYPGIVFHSGNPKDMEQIESGYPFNYEFGSDQFGVIYPVTPGQWSSEYAIEVHKSDKGDFGVSVYNNTTGKVVEQFLGLTYSNVEDKINNNSKFIRIKVNPHPNSTAVTDLKDAGTSGRQITFEHGDGAVYSSIIIKGNTANKEVPIVNSLGDSEVHNALKGRFDYQTAAIIDPESTMLDNEDALLIYSANVGSWGNDIAISISNDDPRIKEPKEKGAFIIDVYKKSNLSKPVETKIVSRKKGVKDGYGQSLFIEDVLKSSAYIRAISNPFLDEDIRPLDLKINFNGVGVPIPVALEGGSNGSAVSIGDLIKASDKFRAKQSYPIVLILDGGLSFVSYQKNLIDIAESRKDCVAILSTPLPNEKSVNYTNEILKYKNEKLNPNTSYAALYSPHIIIYDKDNDRKVPVSPDGVVGQLISKTAANYEIWYPVGGRKRGKVSAMDLIRRFSDGELDILYDNGINPIKYMVGKGITIEGQKTLQAYTSSLDRLNVRLMLIVVESAVMEALENFKFELNTPEVRIIAKSIIDSYMEGIKAKEGVYDFMTVCNETNNSQEDIDNHKLNVMLLVKPPQSIEYIETTVVITRSGIEFKTAAEAI